MYIAPKVHSLEKGYSSNYVSAHQLWYHKRNIDTENMFGSHFGGGKKVNFGIENVYFRISRKF